MKDIRIYVMAHKAFEPPEDHIYIPMQVGAALHESLGYLADNTGDNISAKNPNYNELTGLYWMWKNGPDCDITGLCHYRRFFLDDNGKLLNAADYERILKNYDAVVTEKLVYPPGETVYDGYGENHHTKDLDLTRNAVAKHYPEYLSAFDEVIYGRGMYYANMIVTSKKLLDDYAKWLFTILSDVEEHIDMNGYDDYDRRVFGFLAERLLLVWIRYHHFRVHETHVGIMSAKSDTTEAIQKSAQMLKNGNYKETLIYLNEVQAKRPDLFFKESDTQGELAAIYTFAEIMSAEERAGKHNLISYSTDYRKLTRMYAGLKQKITEYDKTEELLSYITEYNLSIQLVALAIGKVQEEKEERIRVYNALANAYLDRRDINTARMYVGLAMQEG